MNEIIINVDGDNKTIALVKNGILVERYDASNSKKRLEGNIYLGKVQNVLTGMQAAFINIGNNKNTFIHLKDILPKKDVLKEESDDLKKINIKDYIKPGDPLLVEVKRDITMKKGARVSTHINIAGRLCVLMPNTPFITISQKIESKNERDRLKEIAEGILTKGVGAIIRTSAENKPKQEIEDDLKKLLKIWDKIKKESSNTTNIPRLVYKTGGIEKKIFVDLVDNELSKVYVNDENTKINVEETLKELNKINSIKVIYKPNEDLLEMYDLKEQLEKVEDRKVWLKCGGFITIDKTEALTAIDVNSGKYIGKNNLEDTILTVNKEATKEIAKQLRLRDIGGIIVVDYIDMHSEKDKKEILELLEKELKPDRSKTQVVGFTRLNLVEITRKHMCSN